MVCPECGAHLESSDQFCPGCGVRIIRKKRCPECGEMLREGTRFCPSCGEEIPEDYFTRKKSSAGAAPKKNAAPPPKKRPVREQEEEDWDDEEDEESVDVLTIMTVAVGCILLVIIAVLGFNLFQRYMPKNYDRAAREQEEQEEDVEGEEEYGEDGQQLAEDNNEEPGAEVSEGGGTLVIASNVNVRDNPDTQGTTVIKVAQAGESYEYTEVVGGGMWYKVLLPDEDDYEFGYVYADYIELQ
ncbi:MAG: zinc-ribbon domain-containing protein [Lachnospiraceae bacterium]|nr:zinc-ribbon domain-containing protein [Lachnospiraceae bacterium]